MRKNFFIFTTSLTFAALVALPNFADAQTIKVQKGDTLYSISQKYNISLNDLMKSNNLKSSSIFVGQTLNVSSVNNTTVKKQIQTKPNDPLNVRSSASMSGSILGKLPDNTIVTVLKTQGEWSYIQYNNLKGYVYSSYLTNVTTSPAPPPTTKPITTTPARTYVVKSGDTLYKIGQMFKVSHTDIAKWNNMSSFVIFKGQTLIVSANNANPQPTPPPSNNTPPPVSSAKTYVVKSGDTLYKIGQMFKVSHTDIAKWNNMSSFVIFKGQTLIVSAENTSTQPTPEPAKESKALTYTVLKGDTLFSIANNHKTSVTIIKQLNNLSSNTIHVGQVLKMQASVFQNPAEGRLTSDYGYRTHPITNQRSFHHGIDIAKSGIVPITAAYDGVVTRANYHFSYGYVVFVLHTINGKEYETVYAHLRGTDVELGQTVSKGQQLGLMGTTGNSTGQHLHFEIHEGRWNGSQTNSVDPLKFVY